MTASFRQPLPQAVDVGDGGGGDHVGCAGTELVQAIMRRRLVAFANAIAACAMACSLWARKVGRASPAAWSASPSAATLPWPKIAHMPANKGHGAPSISVRWATRKRTSACAAVSLIVVIHGPPAGKSLHSWAVAQLEREIGTMEVLSQAIDAVGIRRTVLR
jgi:hypothetical protein